LPSLYSTYRDSIQVKENYLILYHLIKDHKYIKPQPHMLEIALREQAKSSILDSGM